VNGISPEIGKTTVETGRIFQSGGIDGLVLFALILGTAFMFGALIWALWQWQRAVTKQAESCQAQAEAFAKSGEEMADALRDLATALAAGSSAELTFKTAIANLLERAERTIHTANTEKGKAG
jgi:hypothetical protein